MFSILATALAAVAATPPPAAKPQQAFLYLQDPAVRGERPSLDLGRMLVEVLKARLRAIDGVRFRTSAQMPGVTRVLAAHGDLTRLDRVSLIGLRNETGFDGLVAGDYALTDGGVDLTFRFIDFTNGRVFRTRTLREPISAGLFQRLESDLAEFAATLRQTYRVTLRVESNPSDADVKINGKPQCKTPCSRELESGSYEVVVSREGYKAYRHQDFYKAGDRAHLVTTLYNPIAERYLNRAPALRVDSQELGLGYRYMFLNLARPALRELHALSLEYLVRVSSWEAGVGLRLGPSADTTLTSATFVPQVEARRVDTYRLIAPMAVLKRLLFEKFSFLSLWAGGAIGFSDLRSETASQWSFSAEGFVEVVSRVSRSANFSFEIKLDLGLSYLGQLPYVEKDVILFGNGPEHRRSAPLLGPFVGVTFRFVSWNDIF
jgi:hypothetical protein